VPQIWLKDEGKTYRKAARNRHAWFFIWAVRGEPLVSCTFSLEPTSIMALQGSEFASRANTWAVSRRAGGWMEQPFFLRPMVGN